MPSTLAPWKEYEALDEFKALDTDARLQTFDKWAAKYQKAMPGMDGYDPLTHERKFADFTDRKREAISGAKTWTEEGKHIASEVGKSLFFSAAGIPAMPIGTVASAVIGEQSGISQRQGAMISKMWNQTPRAEMVPAAPTDPMYPVGREPEFRLRPAAERIDKTAADFKTALRNGELAALPPEQRVAKLKEWQTRLIDDAKQFHEGHKPAGEEAVGDYAWKYYHGDKQRDLLGDETNVDLLAAYARTRNDQYFERLMQRMTRSASDRYDDDQIERAESGAGEFEKNVMAYGTDPIEQASTLLTAGLGKIVGGVLKGAFKAGTGRLAATGKAVAAGAGSAYLEGISERMSAIVENQMASGKSLDEAEREARKIGAAMAIFGGGVGMLTKSGAQVDAQAASIEGSESPDLIPDEHTGDFTPEDAAEVETQVSNQQPRSETYEPITPPQQPADVSPAEPAPPQAVADENLPLRLLPEGQAAQAPAPGAAGAINASVTSGLVALQSRAQRRLAAGAINASVTSGPESAAPESPGRPAIGAGSSPAAGAPATSFAEMDDAILAARRAEYAPLVAEMEAEQKSNAEKVKRAKKDFGSHPLEKRNAELAASMHRIYVDGGFQEMQMEINRRAAIKRAAESEVRNREMDARMAAERPARQAAAEERRRAQEAFARLTAAKPGDRVPNGEGVTHEVVAIGQPAAVARKAEADGRGVTMMDFTDAQGRRKSVAFIKVQNKGTDTLPAPAGQTQKPPQSITGSNVETPTEMPVQPQAGGATGSPNLDAENIKRLDQLSGNQLSQLGVELGARPGTIEFANAVDRATPEALSKALDAATFTRKKKPDTTPQAAAKVKEQVQTVAATEGPREVKAVASDIIAQLDATDKARDPANPKSVTFEIPGDGTFTIRDTAENIASLRKRVKRLPQDVKPDTTAPEARQPPLQARSVAHTLSEEQLRGFTVNALNGDAWAQEVVAAYKARNESHAQHAAWMEGQVTGKGFTNLNPSGKTAGFLNADIINEAADLIRQGFTDFAAWSRAMLSRFGQSIREHLQSIWAAVQDEARMMTTNRGAINPGGTGGIDTRATSDAMASDTGAAQNANEPSPGGLSEAESTAREKSFDLVKAVAARIGSQSDVRGRFQSWVDHAFQKWTDAERQNAVEVLFDDAWGGKKWEENARPLSSKIYKGLSEKVVENGEMEGDFKTQGTLSSLASQLLLDTISKEASKAGAVVDYASTGSRYVRWFVPGTKISYSLLRLSDHKPNTADHARPFFDSGNKLNSFLKTVNDEASKVSQGGFQQQESSKAAAISGNVAGTIPPQTPPSVNPKISGAENRAGFTNLHPSGKTSGRVNADATGLLLLADTLKTMARQARDLAEFSRRALARFGAWIKPHLRALWNAAKDAAGDAVMKYLEKSGAIRYAVPPSSAPASQPGTGNREPVETLSRFAHPDTPATHVPKANEAFMAEADAYLDSVPVEAALAAVESARVPGGMTFDNLPSIGERLLQRLTAATQTGTEAQRLIAESQLARAGRAWEGLMSLEAGRALQQRSAASARLVPIAPVLAAKRILVDRAEAVTGKRFDGGAEGAAGKVQEIAERAGIEASNELSAALSAEVSPEERAARISTITASVSRYFGGRLPARVRVVFEPGAGFDAQLNNGVVEVNAATIDPSAVAARIEHEIGHLMYADPAARAEFDKLWASLKPEERAQIEQLTAAAYDAAERGEEASVRALDAIRQTVERSNPSLWQRFKAWVVKTWNRLMGRDTLTPEARAAQMIAKGVRVLQGEVPAPPQTGVRQSKIPKTSALAKMLNALRNKIAPGMTWADIFTDMPQSQKERQKEIYRRLMLDERLKALTPAERIALTNELDKAWQRERRKVFIKELEKAGVMGEKDKGDRAKVKQALPKLLRFLNLGLMNSELFREAIAPEYGVRTMTAAQGAKLRDMFERAHKEPEGIRRNRLLFAGLMELQRITGIPLHEMVANVWVASVLSGAQTLFETAITLGTGGLRSILQQGIGAALHGNPRAALAGLQEFFTALPQVLGEARRIIGSGEIWYLEQFGREAAHGLNGLGINAAITGERLLTEDALSKKAVGLLLAYTGRMMGAFDHLTNTTTTRGTLAMAKALHPDLYAGALRPSAADKAAARKQALAEETGGREPATGAERALVNRRVRDILDSGVAPQVVQESKEMGAAAAFQEDPQGAAGLVYHALNSLFSFITNKTDNVGNDATQRAWVRSMMLMLSSNLRAAMGAKFIRFAANLGTDMLALVPGTYAVQKAGMPLFGRKLSKTRANYVLGANVVGLLATGAAWAFFGGKDEEEDGWHMAGPLVGLSDDKLKRLLAQGIQPMSFYRKENGKVNRVVSYKNHPLLGVLGVVGGMEDARRHTPEKWKDTSIPEHLLNAGSRGLLQLGNVSAVDGLGAMFGGGQRATYGDPVKNGQDQLVRQVSRWAGGFIPNAIRDFDHWNDPRLYKPETAMEEWMRNVPLLRRSVADGRPQINILGEPITNNRYPWQRTTKNVETTEAARVMGVLMSRGVNISLPDTDKEVWKDGKKVPISALGAAAEYRYQKRVGDAYSAWLGSADGHHLLTLPPDQAAKAVSTKTAAIKAAAASGL